MGRPTPKNPKNISLILRIDEEVNQKLEKLSARDNVSKAQVIRALIRKAK